jgi:hypothetical protein
VRTSYYLIFLGGPFPGDEQILSMNPAPCQAATGRELGGCNTATAAARRDRYRRTLKPREKSEAQALLYRLSRTVGQRSSSMFDYQRKRLGHAAWLRSWLALAALCALFFSTSAAHAGDGIGTVWTSDVTQTSFVVHWDYKAKDYSAATGFKICVKVTDTLATACAQNIFDWSWQYDVNDGNARSFLVTGVGFRAGESYKIKVLAKDVHKKRKTWAGRFLKWASQPITSDLNKIGITEATLESPPGPPAIGAAFWVSAVDAHHVTLSWKFSGTAPTRNLHLCVKTRWALTSLHECKTGNERGQDPKGKGSFPITNLSATSVTLDSNTSFEINDSTNYIFYLVDGIVLGEAKATTPRGY